MILQFAARCGKPRWRGLLPTVYCLLLACAHPAPAPFSLPPPASLPAGSLVPDCEGAACPRDFPAGARLDAPLTCEPGDYHKATWAEIDRLTGKVGAVREAERARAGVALGACNASTAYEHARHTQRERRLVRLWAGAAVLAFVGGLVLGASGGR